MQGDAFPSYPFPSLPHGNGSRTDSGNQARNDTRNGAASRVLSQSHSPS